MSVPTLPTVIFTVLFACTVGLVAPARADTAQPTRPGTVQSLDPPADDSELTTFVSATVRLVGVQHGYMMMMQGEDDPDRLDDMRRHAVDDMRAAVQQDGMSIERYNAIATALKTDSQLQSRVESILHEMANDPDDQDKPDSGD